MLSTRMHQVLLRASAEFGTGLFQRQDLQRRVAEALDETGRWEKRKSPLAAPLVVFFVLAMALFRSLSIKCLMLQFFLWMRDSTPGLPLRAVTPEAMCHARARLGTAPLKTLFQKLAVPARESARFQGLRPWAIDGVHMTMPDTPANVAEFGKPGTSRGVAAFPQMLAVALVDASGHLIRDVVLGRTDAPERSGCEEMVKRLSSEPHPSDELAAEDCDQLLGGLGSGDLLMMDRGFAAVWLFQAIMARKIRFLCRISEVWKPKPTKRLGPGDWLVQVRGPGVNPKEAKRLKPEGGGGGDITLTLRMIEYRIRGGERVRLLTDLLDPRRHPAAELAPGYHLRWEGELCYDEIKTHLATVNQGKLHTILRSKSPDGVVQEAYGLFAAYNLVRSLILEASEEHGIPPLEISFTEALQVIRHALPRFERANDADLPRLKRELLADIAACRLDRPRRHRCAPRAIKVKMSNWKLKRPTDRQQRVNFAEELKLCG